MPHDGHDHASLPDTMAGAAIPPPEASAFDTALHGSRGDDHLAAADLVRAELTTLNHSGVACTVEAAIGQGRTAPSCST